MEKEKEILSDVVIFSKYARYIEDKKRRETWDEIVDRNKSMHIKKFPQLKDKIEEVYKLVLDKKVLPSMRSMQFAGKPIELNPSRVFNCAYLPMDHWKSFSEVMFLLLGGTGVGYSVQKHHVDQLPELRRPTGKRPQRYVIGDSIEGWSDSIKALIKSYFFGTRKLRFVYDDIRPKGARLVTSGGKAPGPEPLRICLTKIESLLNEKKDGDKLTPLEVHDINCYIADAVLAGGIRRAAMISLFSMKDVDMLSCKSGSWWELNPQRGRANNSAVILRPRINKEEFESLWLRIKMSGSGEPGVYFTNDKDWGTNPCCEIALRPFQFCNLTEINASNIESQDDFNERAWAASFLGTLQASYTDFHYLRPVWQETTERDALIGVSMTGISSMNVFKYNIEEAVEVVKETNIYVSKAIGINSAARTTCVKPAGTTSLVLGTSSGIHAWYNKFYIRRMRIDKNESIYSYLEKEHPELLEDDITSPLRRSLICVPQKAPDGAITRHEPALDLLERVKKISSLWVKKGHIKGTNTHNVSATISIKDDEWDEVGEWMWKNKEFYNGLSVLPYDGGTYFQTPFEDCTENEYNRLVKNLHSIDLSNVLEENDGTNLQGEIACGGGSCEVK